MEPHFYAIILILYGIILKDNHFLNALVCLSIFVCTYLWCNKKLINILVTEVPSEIFQKGVVIIDDANKTDACEDSSKLKLVSKCL